MPIANPCVCADTSQANMREMVNARMEQNRKSAITDAEDSTGVPQIGISPMLTC